MFQDYKGLHNIIAENCRSLRKQRQMTQVQLEEKTGINLSTIKNIEREDKDYLPKVETIYILADAFGVPAMELLMPKEDASSAFCEGNVTSELDHAADMLRTALSIIEKVK